MAVLKTVSDLPENVRLLCVQTIPTVALYKPGAGLLDKGKKDSVTISQLSGVPIAMEELYQGPVLAAFKAKEADFYLKSLSSSPGIAAKMAEAGLAVALMSAKAAGAIEGEGLAVKQISDGASLAARYCLLTQRGNYRSQVVNNFIGLLAKALDLDLGEELSAPEDMAQV